MLSELTRAVELLPAQRAPVHVHARNSAPREPHSATTPEQSLTVTDTTRAPTRAQPGSNGARPDKQRPISLETERALLHVALLSSDARDVLATVPGGAFAFDKHGYIAATITALHLDHQAVDTITVAAHLERQGLLELVGGGHYIVELWNLLEGTSSAAPRYADTLTSYWHRWRTMLLGDELTAAAVTGTDTTTLVAELNDLHTAAGVGELDLDDMLAALDDTFEERPTILARSDGQHLLYEGAVNVLQSEPVVGKSMLAMIGCAEVIHAGGHALYLDYEDTPRRVARRMVNTIGIATDQLARQFHYKRLYTLTASAVAGLPRLARTVNARLVVIDGLAEALASLGYDENIGTDVAAWWNTVARPLADTGAAVLILDHVTKSKENRGRWARGSGHKLAAVDGAAYNLDTVTPFARGRSGKLKLVIAKDRPGIVGATGDTAATINLTTHEDNERLTWTTQPADTADNWQGPTDCMALVRRLFTEHPELELARSAIAAHIKTVYDKGYRDRTVREAADRLATERVLTTRAQGKRGVYFRLNPDLTDTPEEELWDNF